MVQKCEIELMKLLKFVVKKMNGTNLELTNKYLGPIQRIQTSFRNGDIVRILLYFRSIYIQAFLKDSITTELQIKLLLINEI